MASAIGRSSAKLRRSPLTEYWRAACAETGVDADFYVFRDRSHDAVLPWDIIDGGMKREFFKSEFDKALREEWTLPPKRQKENAHLLPVLQ